MNTYVFVVQSGLIECQALLLAMSLRQYVQKDELIAAWPKQFGPLHPLTRQILEQLQVEIKEIHNDFNPLYPVGNKLFAYNLPSKGDWITFLDSDLICMRPPKDELCSYSATAISTGRYDVITHKEWKNCHEKVGLKIKTDFKHIRSPIVSSLKDLGFAKLWLQNAKTIWSLELRKRRQIDQISLALSAQMVPGFFAHTWIDNPLMLSPTEIYQFDENGSRKPCGAMPIFLVLQKGWLYYKRQGHPKIQTKNPNSLAYYDEIRGLIYRLISDYPAIDRIPSWKILHDLYFSQDPLAPHVMSRYLVGAEGNQK
jgi:hypothetical protein